GNVAIMRRSHIQRAVGPERLRVTEVDAAFGRQTRVGNSVRAAGTRDTEALLEVFWRANLFHNVERTAKGDHFDLGVHALDARLQAVGVVGGVERQPQIFASVLVRTEPRCRAHTPQDLGHAGVALGRLAKFDPDTIRAVSTVRVQGYPSAVRPTPP